MLSCDVHNLKLPAVGVTGDCACVVSRDLLISVNITHISEIYDPYLSIQFQLVWGYDEV